METDVRQSECLKYLTENGIEFELFTHGDCSTMDCCFELDEKIGVYHCKNLFLCNRQKTEYYLVLMDGKKPFRTATVSKLIGCARLSFATPELLRERLNLSPGAVTPLGLIYDKTRSVTVVADNGIFEAERVLVHPCVPTASVSIKTSDLKRIIVQGHKVMFVDIPLEITS